ncbi:hypothetical protein OAQ84_00430 [Bdellovibrionales bacterium]|nr:hypothetical protein [Bdellovibrionales bacterium]
MGKLVLTILILLANPLALASEDAIVDVTSENIEEFDRLLSEDIKLSKEKYKKEKFERPKRRVEAIDSERKKRFKKVERRRRRRNLRRRRAN